jgi:hypothetical protein
MTAWMLSLVLLSSGVDSPQTYVAEVEINTFGRPQTPPRTSVIYRDRDGSIIDWRWYTNQRQIPRRLDNGRFIAIWDDQGTPRTVICDRVRYTRTREDRELMERAVLPIERRRKLR